MCTPVALLGTVLVSKITETVVVVGVSLRMMKLTIPPSLIVYVIGWNPTITTVNEISDDYCNAKITSKVFMCTMQAFILNRCKSWTYSSQCLITENETAGKIETSPLRLVHHLLTHLSLTNYTQP